MNTNSGINLLMSQSKDALPAVGMGATILMWSDRHAATIVEVSANLKTIVIQQDNAKRTDNNGMSESQTYEYSPNTDAPRRTYTLRKNGKYVEKGSPMNGLPLAIGYRREYYDYSH